MRIPKKVIIADEEVAIIYNNAILVGQDAVGVTHYNKSVIYLADKNPDGSKRKRSLIEQTLLHEIVHYILSKMGENDLQSNEKFVDLFASLLHQVLLPQRKQP